MNHVIEFINKFKTFEKENVLINTFTNGYCYYFAIMLRERFGGEIMYDYMVGHFVTNICGKLYDITGDVTDKYNHLYMQQEWSQIVSIIDGCIKKVEID